MCVCVLFLLIFFFLSDRISEVNMYLRLHAHKSVQQTKLANMLYFASCYGTYYSMLLSVYEGEGNFDVVPGTS